MSYFNISYNITTQKKSFIVIDKMSRPICIYQKNLRNSIYILL